MKLAIVGKGGTGKTTLAALLARTLADEGRPIIAIDADPDANLASALGLPPQDWPAPISGMKELIYERTGAKEGYGTFFRMNPDVHDFPEKFSRMVHGVRLLVLGEVPLGGGGCICPESALLKALVTYLLLRPQEIVILDMEAGIEHLGRATAEAVTMMIIVIEPGMRSVQTAQTISRLAKDIRIPRLGVVINRITEGMDMRPLMSHLTEFPLLGTLSLDPAIARADFEGRSPYTGRDPQKKEVRAILEAILSQGGEKGR